MTLWAIVPVKPLRRGKSRLAGTLNEDERTQLNRALLQHSLETLSGVPGVNEVLVVSRDPNALAIAREHGARTVQEDGTPHLNTALKRATVVAQVYATQGVLILPADLPLILSAPSEITITALRFSGRALSSSAALKIASLRAVIPSAFTSKILSEMSRLPENSCTISTLEAKR